MMQALALTHLALNVYLRINAFTIDSWNRAGSPAARRRPEAYALARLSYYLVPVIYLSLAKVQKPCATTVAS